MACNPTPKHGRSPLVPRSIWRVANRAVIIVWANDLLPSDLLICFGTHRQPKSEKERVYYSIAKANRSSNHVTRHYIKGSTENNKSLHGRLREQRIHS